MTRQMVRCLTAFLPATVIALAASLATAQPAPQTLSDASAAPAVATLSTSDPNAAALSFAAALDQVLERDQPLERLRNQVDLEAAEYDFIRGDKRPSLILTGNSSLLEQFATSSSILSDRSVDSSARLTLSQLIFDNGNTKQRLRRQDALQDAASLDLAAGRRSAINQAAQIYFTVQGLRERLAIRDSGIEIVERQQRSAELRFEIGDGTRTEIGFASARLASIRRERLIDQAALDIAVENFTQSFGIIPPTLRWNDWTCPALPQDFDAFRRVAVDNHPALRARLAEEEAAQHGAKAADSTFGPRLSVDGGLVGRVSDLGGFFDRQESIGAQATINFIMPIATGGQGRAVRERAAITVLNATASRIETERRLMVEARAVWSDYQALKGALEEAAISVEAAQLAFRGATRERDAGLRSDLDVLDAETRYLNARLAQTDLTTRAAIATTRLITASENAGCLGLVE